MKKIILFISIILILTGCNNQLKDNQYENNEIPVNKEEDNKEENIDTYTDNNEVTVSLYLNNKKVTTYDTTLSNFKDIAVFDIFYTNLNTVTESI